MVASDRDLILIHVSGQSLAASRHVPLLEAFARHGLVLHVDPTPVFGVRGRRELAESLGRIDSMLCGRAPREIVRVPVAALLPGSRFLFFARWNRWLALRSVSRYLARGWPTHRRVVFCTFPLLLPTLRGLDADAVVYEARDDYVALYAGRPGTARVERTQRRMVTECDLAWAVSKTLATRLRRHRADVIETSNGVDVDAFAVAATEPPAIATIGRPRIGLLGNLNDRVDWKLLESLARSRPAWQIVLVGPLYEPGTQTRDGLARLKELENFHLLPAVPAADIPAWMHAFDVGIIPYRLYDVTEAINPLKAYQYLAAGKPVVATSLPALEPLKSIVRLCRDQTEFIESVEAALAEGDDAALGEERRRRVREYSWDSVAQRRIEIVREHLAGRERPTPGYPKASIR